MILMTAMTKPLRLYESRHSPDRWIGEDERGRLWSWERRPDGWAQRGPHAGRQRNLTEVEPALARGTGWPGAGVGRRRLAGAELGRPRTVRIDDTRWNAVMEAADRAAVGVSDWVRQAIDRELARSTRR